MTVLLLETNLVVVSARLDVGAIRDRIQRVDGKLLGGRLLEEYLRLIAGHSEGVPQESGV